MRWNTCSNADSGGARRRLQQQFDKRNCRPAELTKFSRGSASARSSGAVPSVMVRARPATSWYRPCEDDACSPLTSRAWSWPMNRRPARWCGKKDLELPVSGGVGVGYGLVLLGTLKGEVIALDSTSGEEKWRARVTSEVLAAPASNGNVVVVQTQDDRLIGLRCRHGDRRWIYESTPAVLTLRGTGAPMVTNRLVVAGLSSGKVIAVDVQRGLPGLGAACGHPAGPFRTGACGRHRRRPAAVRRHPVRGDLPGPV